MTVTGKRDWGHAALAEVATIERRALSPSEIRDGTLYVGLEHMDSSGGFLDVGPVQAGDLASTKFQFTPGHILYGKLRPYLAKIARPTFSGVCSTDILPIAPGPSINKDFLYYYLRQPQMIDLATAQCSGANLPRLSPRHLAEFQIPLPSLPEQKRIAAILDQADAIRRKRRQAIQAATDLVLAWFFDLFGDVCENVKGYPLRLLGEVAELDRGKSRNRPRDAAHLYGGPYPFIQTGDIANADGRILSYSQTYSEAGLAQSRLWPAGTLCITIAANIADTAILTFDACFPDSVVGLVPLPDILVEYVQYWLVAMKKRLEDSATQVAQKNINLQLLRNLTIPLPPMAQQRQFADALSAIRQLRDRQTYYSHDSDALFGSLTHRAFRGEL